MELRSRGAVIDERTAKEDLMQFCVTSWSAFHNLFVAGHNLRFACVVSTARYSWFCTQRNINIGDEFRKGYGVLKIISITVK